jgi:hypothetical protein
VAYAGWIRYPRAKARPINATAMMSTRGAKIQLFASCLNMLDTLNQKYQRA